MTFKKTTTAIIVATIFSLPITLTHAQPINKSGAYTFGPNTNTLDFTIDKAPEEFGNYLIFGEKHAANHSKELSLTLTATHSTLTLDENIKLRTHSTMVEHIDDSLRPEATKFDLNFTDCGLTGDIINQYDGIRNYYEGQDQKPKGYVIAAQGNNTTVTLNGSEWIGSLYQQTSKDGYNSQDTFYSEENQTHNNVITLSNKSTWTGYIKNSSKGTNTVTIDNTSTWDINDYSNVNSLTSNGNVIINGAILTFDKGQSKVKSLNIESGVIQMNQGADVDITNITGAAADISFMSLKNSQLKIDTADKPLSVYVYDSVDNDLDKTLAALDKQLITGQNIGGTFTIDQSLIGDGGYGSIVGDKLTLSGRTKNTNLITTSELVAIQMMQWRTEADDMNQRMGELRDSTDANGLWVRTYGGKSEASLVDNKFVGFQFGYDHNVASSSANQQFVGGAISYTKGDANFSTGTGDNDTFAFTGYSTWLLDGGSYVDLSAKYGKLNSDFNIKTGLGNLNGDYSTHALAMGVEVGHRLPVTNLFYVEPQLAFTASHIFAEDFGAGQGLTIEQDSINSYVARAGLAVGLKCPDNMGSVWMKASYLYDFDGETTTTAKNASTTNQYAQDFGGGWYELGLGASMNLTKNLHGYADFEYASGSEIETPYKWNVGVRYTY